MAKVHWHPPINKFVCNFHGYIVYLEYKRVHGSWLFPSRLSSGICKRELIISLLCKNVHGSWPLMSLKMTHQLMTVCRNLKRKLFLVEVICPTLMFGFMLSFVDHFLLWGHTILKHGMKTFCRCHSKSIGQLLSFFALWHQEYYHLYHEAEWDMVCIEWKQLISHEAKGWVGYELVSLGIICLALAWQISCHAYHHMTTDNIQSTAQYQFYLVGIGINTAISIGIDRH